MDRKKKLETSLEGLFSKSKSAPEPVEVEKKLETPAPAAEKAKKSAVSAKKSTSKKASEKMTGMEKLSSPESGAAAPDADTTPETIFVDTVIPEVEPEPALKAKPTPEPVVIEIKTDRPVKKVDQTLATTADNELAAAEEVKIDIQLLVFEINKVQYAIDVSLVQTIIKPQAVFLVPGTAEYLKGLINLRGEVVPVVDLRTRFDLPIQESTKDTRFVVVRVNDIGASMVVDKVHGVETIPLNVIEKPSGLVMDIDNRYLTGMARYEEQIILILDLLQTIRPQVVEQR
jgi:purine-binding chemotaxis protein CheW